VIKLRSKTGKKCAAVRAQWDYRVIYDVIQKSSAAYAVSSCKQETENPGSVNLLTPEFYI
jgi:hypothetical protein